MKSKMLLGGGEIKLEEYWITICSMFLALSGPGHRRMQDQTGHLGFASRTTGLKGWVHVVATTHNLEKGQSLVWFSYTVLPAVAPFLPLESDHHRSRTAVVTVFVEVDSLPCSQAELACRDGNGERTSHEGALHVCRHVIQSFIEMPVHLPFRYDAVERIFHVQRHVWRRVFVDGERRAGMHDEQVGDSHFVLSYFFDLLHQVPRDHVATSGEGRQTHLFLRPGRGHSFRDGRFCLDLRPQRL